MYILSATVTDINIARLNLLTNELNSEWVQLVTNYTGELPYDLILHENYLYTGLGQHIHKIDIRDASSEIWLDSIHKLHITSIVIYNNYMYLIIKLLKSTYQIQNIYN